MDTGTIGGWNVDTCVICGAVIPEGRMICPMCEKGETEMNYNSAPRCPANEVSKPVKDTMWHFLMLGGQKANVPALKEAVNDLCHSAMQKNAGNRKDKAATDINWSRDLDSIMWRIVFEATALVLSGELDKLEA